MQNSPSNAEHLAQLVAKLQAHLDVDADGVRKGYTLTDVIKPRNSIKADLKAQLEKVKKLDGKS